MHVQSLDCVRCGESYPADAVRYGCECGGSVDVTYDYDEIQGAVSWESLQGRPFDHYRYKEFLPVVEDEHRIVMGAGGTPLVRSKRIGPELGIDLWFKMESLNPSGSFKDRGTSVELGKAMDHGADEVVVASTGNMGASIAAYTARAGVTATIYVPEAVERTPKFKQMRSHGANIRIVDGDYNAAAKKAWAAYEEHGTYLMGDYPYRGEGQKTVGYEIVDQSRNEFDVDTVVAPVGNGTLIHAVWKGFEELQAVGLLGDAPRVTGVQADGCNTVVNALQKGFDEVQSVEQVETVAGAIACGDPLDGDQAMNAIRESGGFGVAVSDEQILAAKARLAEAEGVYAEEAGAAALAGIVADADRLAGETVVCLVTGHGLKT